MLSSIYRLEVALERGLLAQLVEHIVHIDGVTGSSPVQTTTRPLGGFFHPNVVGGYVR